MPKAENPTLGNINCDCGNTVTVRLQKGRNRKGYFKCGCYEKAVLTAEKTEEFFPTTPDSVAKSEVENAEPSTPDQTTDASNNADAGTDTGSEPAKPAEQSGTDWGVGTAW